MPTIPTSDFGNNLQNDIHLANAQARQAGSTLPLGAEVGIANNDTPMAAADPFQLHTSYANALNTKPDQEAEYRQLADKTSLPLEVVRNMPADALRMSLLNSFDASDFAQKYPVTAQQLTDVNFAKVAHDDIDNMGIFETLANSFRRGVPALQSIPHSMTAITQASALNQYADIDKRVAAGENLRDVLNDDKYASLSIKPMPGASDSDVQAFYNRDRAKTTNNVQSLLAANVGELAALQKEHDAIPLPSIIGKTVASKTTGEFFRNFAQAPGTFIAGIGPESLLQSAPGLVAAIPAGLAGGPVGAAGAIGGGSFLSDYGGELLQNLQGHGVDVADAKAVQTALRDPKILASITDQALKHAAVVGAFDAMSGGIASKTLLPAKFLAATPLKRELVDIAVKAPVMATLGATGEALGEVAAGQALQPGQIGAEFFGEFFGTPSEVVSASGHRYLAQLREAKEAKANAAVLTALHQSATESLLRARDPQSYEQFVQAAAENGPVQDLFIDAHTLQQSGLADQVAAASPAVAAQLPEALATAGDVRIPLADYAAHIAGIEGSDALTQHLKVHPDAMTEAEANELEKNHAAELRQTVEDVLAGKVGDDPFKASQEAVKQSILGNLNAVNRNTAKVNEVYANVAAAYYAARAAQHGILPEEMFARHPINIVDQNGTTGAERTDGKTLAVGDNGLNLVHGSTSADLTHDGITIVRTGQKQGKKGRVYGGFYASSVEDAAHAEGYANMGEGTPTVYDVRVKPGTKVLRKTGDVTRLSEAYINELKAQGYGLVVGQDPRGRTEYAVIDKEAIESLNKRSNTAPTETGGLVDNSQVLNQNTEGNARGSFNPATNTIALLKNADLSTFLHELGHFFFENDIAQAAALYHKADPTEGEKQVLTDVSALLRHVGIQGSLPEQIAQWRSMSFEEQRAHHETIAESFERYLFEGKAPSLDLAEAFQKMRAWMVNVYRSIKEFVTRNPSAGTLSDEVRSVFDRMLATNEQIQLAEQNRSMIASFESLQAAGISAEEIAKIHSLDVQATQDAIQDLQARSLRDLSWLHNARGREIKRLQKLHDALRQEAMIDVRSEVMAEKVYQAWAFLTRRQTPEDKLQPFKPSKSDPNAVDWSQDSLFTAIAKLGGLNKDAVVSTWGVDPKTKVSGGFGKPVLRTKDGGHSIGAMEEKLMELGYLTPDEHGKADPHALADIFDAELRGEKQYSAYVDHRNLTGEQRTAERYNLTALGAGRLDFVDLMNMGLPKEVTDKIVGRHMTLKNGGIHPELVAELMGYSSADEMVNDIAAATPPKEEIEARTDVKMMEEHGEVATPEAMAAAADKAVHNAMRGRVLAAQANAMAKAGGSRKVLLSAAKTFANQMIAKLKIRDIYPSQYAAAETRAGKASDAAARKGDLAVAAAEKKNQLINNLATRAAYDAREEVTKILNYLKKFQKTSTRKNIDAQYVEQIDALLSKFDLRQRSNADVDATTSLRTWVTSQLAIGNIPAISETLLSPKELAAYSAQINSRDAKGELVYPDDDERIKLLSEAIDRSETRSYKDATLDELRGLHDTVKQIEHIGRLKNKLFTARNNETYQETRDALAREVRNNARKEGKNTKPSNTLLGKKLESLFKFGVSHIKPAIWMQIFDGGVINGTWFNSVLRPANEAAAFETTMRAKATEALSAILRPIVAKVSVLDKIGKGVFFPSLDASLNWEERMSFALNYGNESNLQRLMGGGIAGSEKTRALTMAQVHDVLRSLTTEEWRAVQAIWDHLETYRPLIGAKEKRVNGVEPEWIAARPFEVNTLDGDTLSLRGGYYPIKFDGRVNMRAQQHDDASAAKDAMKAAYVAATTRRSFTKSRVDEVNGRPLMLNLQGLYNGINDVIHDLAWHEWVIDYNRFMRSGTIDAAIREHYGANVKSELTRWGKDIAVGSQHLDHGIENVAGWARRFVSSSALTYNVMSAVLQPLGIGQSVTRIGAQWVGKGLAQYASNPREAMRFVQGKSEFMTNRSRTMFRDLNELRNRVAGQTTFRELMGRYGYFLTMHCQLMVDTPTWIGAYEKAVAAEHDEGTAVAFADQAVKDSQGGGEEVDQSGIVRGGPLIKLFTAFYDFMNTQANTLYLKGATANSKAEAFMHFFLIGIALPILTAAIKDAITPGDSGAWDDDKIAKKMASEGLQNLIGMIAFGREFGIAAKALFGEDKGMDYTGPAGLRVIVDTGKLTKQAAQGDLDDSFRRAFVQVLGDLTGIPAVQINRTVAGSQALAENKTDNPAAVVLGYQERK